MVAEARFFLLVDLREFFFRYRVRGGGGGGEIKKLFFSFFFFQTFFSLISPEKY